MYWRCRDTVWAGAVTFQVLSQAVLLPAHDCQAALALSGYSGSQGSGGVSEDAGKKSPVTTTTVPSASKADRGACKKPWESHMSDHIGHHQDHKNSK